MKREFAPELADLEVANEIEYKHLLNWANDGKRLVMEIGYIQDNIFKQGSKDYKTYKGILQGIL